MRNLSMNAAKKGDGADLLVYDVGEITQRRRMRSF
jgi:hypothetical protein